MVAKPPGPYSARVRSAWFLPLVLAVFAGAALLAIGAYARDAFWWIEHTDRVIAQAHLVSVEFTDASAAKRAYLLAARPDLRAAFHDAAERVRIETRRLATLVSDNPPQVRKAERIGQLAAKWLSEAAAFVDDPPEDPATALRIESFARVRDEISGFVDVEAGLRDRRSKHARVATGMATVGTVALLLLFALSVALMSRTSLRKLAHDYQGMLADLQAERTRFRAIFEHAGVGIAQVALDGRWLVVNQRFAEIVGSTRDELMRSTFQEIIHPSDLVLARRLLDGEIPAYQIEKRYLRKDGSVVWVDLTVALVRREDGAPDHFISVVQDISERIASQSQLRKLNAELEHRVRLRTAALRSANSELESFSYSVSHDLRAPLRSIAGFSQALLEDASGKLDAEALEHLGRIRRAAARMSELIDDLLELSRLSRVEVRREKVDLSRLSDDVVRELRHHDPGRQVEVDIESGLEDAADPRLVRIALENLLANAWKFTRGRGLARIEVFSGPRAGQRAFAVRDNGAGFDMAYADQLFKAFHRLHRTEQFEGTGIGLATVRRIVDCHGGRIWAEGAVGEGATFWFTLSAAARSAEDWDMAPPASSEARTSA